MKTSRNLAAIAIAIYVVHALILSPLVSDYVTFVDGLKAFFPIDALQNASDAIEYEGFGWWFVWLLGGIINIGLVAVAVMSLVSKEKPTAPITSQWGVATSISSNEPAPPPPPVD